MACGRWGRRDQAFYGTPHGPVTRHDEGPWDSKHHTGVKANRHGRSCARSSRALGGPARSRRKPRHCRAAQAKGSGLQGSSGKVGQAHGGDAESHGWSKRMNEHLPRIVIVGGGFGGLAAAKALGRSPAEVVLIDRTNHHVFQPLLYQVATSVLAPGQISAPIRGILGKQSNTTVIMAEVTGVNKEERYVLANSADRSQVQIPYDYLILATGQRHSYFGHDEFERFAPGLKSLADAVGIRNRVLQAFEQAEAEEDPSRHADLLTLVLVGAGPTGVEMAAALAVFVRTTLRSEFRRFDPLLARIVLVDMAFRFLGTFAQDFSEAASKNLEACRF